jgi:Concanavalin A-like lectin/glucanases superfamily
MGHGCRVLGMGFLLVLMACPGSAQLRTPDLGHPLLANLISWWSAAPGFTGSTRLFDFVSRNHGALVNMGFGTTSGWAASDRRGGSLHLAFDGVDDYVLIGDLPVYDFPDTTFTVEVAARATLAGYLVAKRQSTIGVQGGGWFLRLDGGGTLTARLLDTGNTTAAQRSSTTTTLLNGTWFHAVVVFTSDTTTLANNDLTMYINGVEDQGARTDSGVGPYIPCVCPLVFGVLADFASGTWLTGAESMIRIWGRGLSAAEVAVLAGQAALDPLSLMQPLDTPAAARTGSPGSFFNLFR